MIKNNDLVFDQTISNAGTGMLIRVDFKKEDIERIAGLTSKEANEAGYSDDGKGYDGWEVRGLFRGERFTLYIRWNMMRIGGDAMLDEISLIEAIKAEL